MKSVMALVLASSGMAVAQDAVQWRVEDGGNGHWYAIFPSEISGCAGGACRASQAEYCIRNGGMLVCLETTEELSWVFETLVNDETVWGGTIGPTIGLYQDRSASDYQEPNGGWYWETGEPLAYTSAWGPGEPNNGSSAEDFAYFGGTGTLIPTWFDGGNGGGPWFLCEWSSDCNTDGIVDYGQILDGSLQDYDQDNIPDICEAKQWPEAEGGNGHWYLYQQDIAVGSVCWSEALARSRSVGGDLVSLTSVEEEDFVRLMNDCLDAPWIGYQGEGLPWSDGEPVGYTNWLSGQPSGDGPYATMTCAPSAAGWNDIGGSSGCWPNLNFWVSEWSADCNNDGIVDFGQILSGTLTDSDRNGIPDQCELGACCLGTGCVVALSSSCDAAGGKFSGVGSTCGSVECEPAVDDCPGDITDDGQVDFTDLLIIVSTWGPCSDG